jgi:CRISPR-associated protein Cmr2
MTTHLLQIALGPVQDFIAQARRTRDLWYGSHLLSEVSRAAARSLAETRHVQLIFPAFSPDNPELAACPQPFRDIGGEQKPPLAVANIILAEMTGADDRTVLALAESVRRDVQSYWRKGLAERVRERCGGLLANGIDAVWDEQIDTFLEFAAAWTEVSEQKDGYKEARARLAKALAARKNLRDFEPWREHRDGVCKSSLDGARMSVLRDGKREKRSVELVRKYRLEENEQLDAVGLVKRAGGETDDSRTSHDLQFVPIFNVALAPWMQHAERAHPVQLEAVKAALLKPEKDIRWPRIARKIACGQKLFGFSASIFLRGRWWPEFKELEIRRQQDATAWRGDVMNWCGANVGPLLRRMSEPYPYVACLVADGDSMGGAIDGLESADKHRNLSRELAEFARKARKIVENAENLGSLLYSGGDDVLAFLPVSTALHCADALRQAFAEIMAGALPAADQKPTLSVGIGVGHVMEPMSDLLDLGRRAEKLAKGGQFKREGKDRNALAVIVDKRSGGAREWRQQWPRNAEQENPVQRLREDQELLTGKLSSRKVYQIAEIVRRLPTPGGDVGDALAGFAPVLQAEVKRALERTDNGGDGLTLKNVQLEEMETASGYAATRKLVLDWVNRVLIARAFAESEPRSRMDGANVEDAA